jgi:DNA polymerase V
VFALIDCNNFYASCERLFRPDLKETPIVVLSNNDGCCIARSNEAKALGIAMGEPYFKIKGFCQQHRVKVFSSNYTLYGNLSHRVMCTIEEAWPKVEVYSIDEAFLDLRGLPSKEHEPFCQALQKKIFRHTGIPTSIGIGQTKTLAKAANFLCKKVFKIPVFYLTPSNKDEFLKRISVDEVWGIGRQWARKLTARGTQTAYDLANTDPHTLKKQFNVVLMRTALELQGVACVELKDSPLRQSIMSSKSFGEMQTHFEPIAQSVSSYCARAVEKMRRQNLSAQRLSVFVQTNRFREDLAQHIQSIEYRLIHPSDDLRLITGIAKRCLKRIIQPGFYYKKAGVCLLDLVPNTTRQIDLFHQHSDEHLAHAKQLMGVFDHINEKYGRSTIRLAAEGYSKPWSMRAEHQSPAYTTRWSDVPKVRID